MGLSYPLAANMDSLRCFSSLVNPPVRDRPAHECAAHAQRPQKRDPSCTPELGEGGARARGCRRVVAARAGDRELTHEPAGAPLAPSSTLLARKSALLRASRRARSITSCTKLVRARELGVLLAL